MSENTALPIQPSERISEIDIVRGLALFGILMVNMLFFKAPVYIDHSPTGFPPVIEQAGAWIIQLFFTGKFYAIFSFLFGFGFYIFMERVLQKGLLLLPLYRRRLFALLAIGFIHLFFLWTGDILFTYAIAGFMLLGFRDKPLRSLKKWISGLVVTALILNFLFWLVAVYGEYALGEEYAVIRKELIAKAVAVYSNAGFMELVAYRAVNELPFVLINLLVWLPAVLAFFLCGLYAGKMGVFKDLAGHAHLLRKARNVGLPVGALLMLLYALFEIGMLPAGVILKPALLEALNYAASLFIFPAYVALVLLALQKNFFKKLFAPVAAAGRMALTNYLMQTLICITLFYGFGFGLFGKITVAQGILLTIAIYLAQIPLSNLWLKKYAYGPMEWLWRSLTYKKIQPLLLRKQQL